MSIQDGPTYVVTTTSTAIEGGWLLAEDPGCALDVGASLPTSLVVVRARGRVRQTACHHRVTAQDVQVIDRLPVAAAFGPNGQRVLNALANLLRDPARGEAHTVPSQQGIAHRESLAEAWFLAAQHDRLLAAGTLVHSCAGRRPAWDVDVIAAATGLLLGALMADVAPVMLLQALKRPWQVKANRTSSGLAGATSRPCFEVPHGRR